MCAATCRRIGLGQILDAAPIASLRQGHPLDRFFTAGQDFRAMTSRAISSAWTYVTRRHFDPRRAYRDPPPRRARQHNANRIASASIGHLRWGPLSTQKIVPVASEKLTAPPPTYRGLVDVLPQITVNAALPTRLQLKPGDSCDGERVKPSPDLPTSLVVRRLKIVSRGRRNPSRYTYLRHIRPVPRRDHLHKHLIDTVW